MWFSASACAAFSLWSVGPNPDFTSVLLTPQPGVHAQEGAPWPPGVGTEGISDFLVKTMALACFSLSELYPIEAAGL